MFLVASACSDSRSSESSTHPGQDAGRDSSTRPGSDSGTVIGSDGAAGSDARVNAETGASAAGNTSSAASWFASAMYFNQPVDTAALDPQSSTVINNLVANGGWGLGHIQVDFSIDVYYADVSSQQLPFSPTGVAMPDSDIPMTVPVDPNSVAGFESSSGKTCDGGDCHYLVVDSANSRLIEIYQAQASGTQFSANGGSVAIWSFTKPYPAALRGDVCTSADASGGLMAPLLFTAEEVAAGHIDHAIRFILPNSRIQNQEYVRPATHGTGGAIWATSGGVPYGARFRLKPSFDASMLSAGAQVVVAGLKKYGMILSDGGNVALTAKSDRVSTTKWTNLGSHDLETLVPGDFEMVEASYGTDAVSSSQRFDFTSYTCTRLP
jgi:serine/threonine-protein kinase